MSKTTQNAIATGGYIQDLFRIIHDIARDSAAAISNRSYWEIVLETRTLKDVLATADADTLYDAGQLTGGLMFSLATKRRHGNPTDRDFDEATRKIRDFRKKIAPTTTTGERP